MAACSVSSLVGAAGFILVMLTWSQNGLLAEGASVRDRVERQVEQPPTDGGGGSGMTDVMPWVEMGTKYGFIAATAVVIPMGLEILNNTGQG